MTSKMLLSALLVVCLSNCTPDFITVKYRVRFLNSPAKMEITQDEDYYKEGTLYGNGDTIMIRRYNSINGYIVTDRDIADTLAVVLQHKIVDKSYILTDH